MSIISGLFPKELEKTNKIIPIHKKNSKVEPGNYRPVSILSIISKIFERVVCEQLQSILHVIIIFMNCNLVFDRIMANSSFRISF